MYNFSIINEDEFQQFSDQHPQATFLQTVKMGNLRKKRHWQVEYVGVKQDGVLIGAALLAHMKIKLGYYYEIDGGMLVDYTNTDLVSYFVESLKTYIKKNNGIYLSIKPNLVYQERDWNGQAIGEPNKKAYDLLSSLGFHHEGFESGFSGDSPRWIFAKALVGMDQDSLWKSYQKSAQYSIKKTQEYGVKVRELSYEELPKFKELTAHTSERRQFHDKDLAYYQAVYQEFGESAKFIVAEINFADYIHNIREKERHLKEKLATIYMDLEANPNSRKKNNQKREFEDELKTFEKRIADADEFKSLEGDVIVAGALFIQHPQEVVYLFSGTYDQYKKFYAPYMIQHDMMRYTVAQKIPTYNFYGVSGLFDGSDGVLKFKQSFTGYVEEHIGSFDLIVNPVKYKLYTALKNVVGKLRG
ncbi:aminoacyltransferase [Isobaculum melis]|uniref:Aminoacyltransferase FemA n=1 Tax=Isobaculum melis TaxID=142588 RepID=A0A1H9RQ78_9LACT|nr:aminoacyltransferase [Isobaculum melis]SER75131.1 alanine adding enzyme [Isobaculum melis]